MDWLVVLFKWEIMLVPIVRELSKYGKGEPMDIGTLKRHLDCCFRLIELHNSVVTSASFDKSIKLWDISLYIITCIATLTGHTQDVCCLIQLRNGDLVSVSYDKTIKIWNIETKVCIQTLIGHTNVVRDLFELKNGNIVSGSWDGTIKIWERI